MQTLKTAFVVVLLLVLLYGVYVVLSKPDAQRAASDLARHLAPSGADRNASPYDAMEAPWEGGPPVSIGGSSPMAAQAGDAAADPWGGGEADGGPAPRDFSGRSQVALAGASSAVLDGYPASPGGPPAHSGHHAQESGPNVMGGAAAAPGGHLSRDHAPRDPRHAGERSGSHSRQEPPESPTATFDRPPAEAAPAGDEPGAAREFRDLGSRAFGKAMQKARQEIREGRYREALERLSMFYNSPDLTPDEHSELLNLLDPLAAEVVYSRRHLLADPYEAGRNETLMDIAQRFQVPWQLLANINGVSDPEVLVPGTEIKVVSGPFRAEVDVQRGELTVFLGRLYAGRFLATFGKDPAPEPGSYEVRDKRTDRSYFAADGRTIRAGEPENPYGRVWLDLGGEMSIHGSPSAPEDSRQRLGCISLTPGDARDVYAILSVGSQVLIR